MKKNFTLNILLFVISLSLVSKLSAQITDLQTLKNLYTAPGIVLPSAVLTGVVISDTANKNISKGNTIFQCGNRGVSLYVGANTYSVGDSISVDVTGDSLIIFKNAFEIKRKKGAVNPTPIAKGVSVKPAIMTITDIIANIATVQCTLVKVVAAKATPAGTFSGAKTLTDASGNFTLFTATGATFAATTMPTSTMDWIGYPVVFNTTNEFLIRSVNDISTPLPLSFKAFSADTKGLSASLKWNTAAEVNTDKFIVEKSFDGVKFSSLYTITAKGKASNTYTYTDVANKNNTIVYYRLKSVDKDGKFVYSSTVKVKYALAVMLTAYPNPTTNNIHLDFEAFQAEQTARIFNSEGRLMKQVTIPAGTTTSTIVVANLVSGLYHVTIGDNNSTKISSGFIKN